MDEEDKAPAPPAKKAKRKKLIRIFAGVVLLAVIAACIWFFSLRDTSPIPQNIRQSVNFALYYPTSLPAGYTLDKSTIKNANSIILYTLRSGSENIGISEQAEPKSPPDLTAIQKYNTSFKNVSTPAGQAILGIDSASKSPSAIIVTNTTLISLFGSTNVPTDAMTKLVQNMTSLPQ